MASFDLRYSHACPVPGCRFRRQADQTMCTSHWLVIPPSAREAVLLARTLEERQQREQDAIELAKNQNLPRPGGRALIEQGMMGKSLRAHS